MESKWKANLIKMLMAKDIIREKVGWRIYPARLASVQTPKFPCINFESEGGIFPYERVAFSTFSIRFWFYFETSMEDANVMYSEVDSILRNSAVTGTKISAILNPASKPIELFEKGLFGLTVNYFGRSIHA